jgi:hypothetical protein
MVTELEALEDALALAAGSGQAAQTHDAAGGGS